MDDFLKEIPKEHQNSLGRCFVKKDVLENFVRKHLRQENTTGFTTRKHHNFLKKAPTSATFLKMRLSCFPVNFAKFLRTPF